MPLPSVLLRNNSHLNKKDFGHVLVVAGSPNMLGACALTSLAAMRSGAGMVTTAVAKSLNLSLQEKLSNVVMTLSLKEKSPGLISDRAFQDLKEIYSKFNAVAIGPGLGLESSTKKFIYQMVEQFPGPIVIDADAINALALNLNPLIKAKGQRILTPHEGEMTRLLRKKFKLDEVSRRKIALDFANKFNCVVVLKGHRTVVASPNGKIKSNTTGNVGMATAGSGDVLTGMIAAFLAQGIGVFESSCLAVYWHGIAGDKAAKKYTKVSMLATDIIENIPGILNKK